jgi:hypothetical protein
MALREPFPGFPPPLTTRPEGLLSMLGLQTNGSYPQHLAYDNLVPQIDLLNWYLESRAEVNTPENFAVNAAPGNFVTIWQVPAQEVWVLLACTLRPVTIASACTLQLARTRSNDNGSRIALSDPVAFSSTSFPLVPSRESVRYIVFRPSVQIGCQFVAGSGVGNTFDGCLRFVRCTI